MAIQLNNALPPGCVADFAGGTAPAGWLFCDGLAISRTTYAGLFAAIGTAFGAGDGATTFNLPDARGRACFGKDNMGGTAANRITAGGSGVAGATLGAVGGGETLTITTSQMASHQHVDGYSATAGTGRYGTTDTGLVSGHADSSSSVSNNIGANTSSVGGGGAHANIPPAIILNKIIKF